MDIGLQLWSFTSNEKKIGFTERMELASKMGFTSIEYDGSYEKIEKEKLLEMLEKLNLKLVSAHVGYGNLDDNLEYLASLGVKHILCPSASYNSHEEALIIAKRLNEFGEKCRPFGIKTGFHNHANDFYIENGKPIVETIYDNTNPETVIIQLDVGHAVGGGADPFDLIERYKGRIESIHIKENKGSIFIEKRQSHYDKTPKWKFEINENGEKIFEKAYYEDKIAHEKMAVAMGESDIDWKKIIEKTKEKCEDATFIIEREVSYNEPKDRLKCIEEDFEYIKNLY